MKALAQGLLLSLNRGCGNHLSCGYHSHSGSPGAGGCRFISPRVDVAVPWRRTGLEYSFRNEGSAEFPRNFAHKLFMLCHILDFSLEINCSLSGHLSDKLIQLLLYGRKRQQ